MSEGLVAESPPVFVAGTPLQRTTRHRGRGPGRRRGARPLRRPRPPSRAPHANPPPRRPPSHGLTCLYSSHREWEGAEPSAGRGRSVSPPLQTQEWAVRGDGRGGPVGREGAA